MKRSVGFKIESTPGKPFDLDEIYSSFQDELVEEMNAEVKRDFEKGREVDDQGEAVLV